MYYWIEAFDANNSRHYFEAKRRDQVDRMLQVYKSRGYHSITCGANR